MQTNRSPLQHLWAFSENKAGRDRDAVGPNLLYIHIFVFVRRNSQSRAPLELLQTGISKLERRPGSAVWGARGMRLKARKLQESISQLRSCLSDTIFPWVIRWLLLAVSAIVELLLVSDYQGLTELIKLKKTFESNVIGSEGITIRGGNAEGGKQLPLDTAQRTGWVSTSPAVLNTSSTFRH